MIYDCDIVSKSLRVAIIRCALECTPGSAELRYLGNTLHVRAFRVENDGGICVGDLKLPDYGSRFSRGYKEESILKATVILLPTQFWILGVIQRLSVIPSS
ncbi:hypothetical protein L6164_022420 [Bauhinia variegata]|uniref:Uncharacterized protein n=1 Tax=Bauhinia variegata TaxID=167791 RepID=A0ACB9MEY7_BAUVA|nr:hypothetical protein L6164_022420 [Bauhinia variegata]